MSMEHVCEWFVIILDILLPVMFLYYCKYYVKNNCPKCCGSVKLIANKDLKYLGKYNFRTRVSTKYWIYAIAVSAYKIGKYESIFDTFIGWNAKYNFDPFGFISEGIDCAKTEFTDAIQKAKDNNESVKFGLSSDYDYHNYPLSFRYNDYIDCNSLIEIVDEILEVK